jgi:hypothetical protein
MRREVLGVNQSLKEKRAMKISFETFSDEEF